MTVSAEKVAPWSGSAGSDVFDVVQGAEALKATLEVSGSIHPFRGNSWGGQTVGDEEIRLRDKLLDGKLDPRDRLLFDTLESLRRVASRIDAEIATRTKRDAAVDLRLDEISGDLKRAIGDLEARTASNTVWFYAHQRVIRWSMFVTGTAAAAALLWKAFTSLVMATG